MTTQQERIEKIMSDTVDKIRDDITECGNRYPDNIDEILTSFSNTIHEELAKEVEGNELINAGITEDTPTCDNESCSAFNAYNQAVDVIATLCRSKIIK